MTRYNLKYFEPLDTHSVMGDTAEIVELFARYSQKSGAVSAAEVESSRVYTRAVDGTVVAAATVEHGAKVTSVHKIAVDSAHRREGHGSALLTEIVSEAGDRITEAKVRVGLASNDFFRANGWTNCRQTGDGEMNVWHAH